MSSILLRAKGALGAVARREGLSNAPVDVSTRTLTTEEAIGKPEYDDLPILRGKEVMIEAAFRGAKGHAFTSSPSPWSGTLRELLALPLTRNEQQAVFCAAANAVLRSLGAIDRTVHCRDEDIAECGRKIATQIYGECGRIRVGMVGYQPGLLASLVEQLGAENVRVIDLAEANVGRRVHGVEIWDGAECAEKLVATSDRVLATGSTAANGTLDELMELAADEGTPLTLYGVSAAAVCHLCGVARTCTLAT
jgi:uncharacterized protein (DUF4213/DUF364 family)